MSPCGRRKVPDTSPPASARTAIKPATKVTAVTATRRNLTTERIGGSARQWADELITAVLDHHAAGFIYRSPDDTPAADQALARRADAATPRFRPGIRLASLGRR